MKRQHALMLGLALAVAMPLGAQQTINETRPASADAVVSIENISGSVEVQGWSRDEVEVTGTLGRGTERLDFDSNGRRVDIRVVIPKHSHNVKASHLTVRVPERSRLKVETVSADISVSDATGRVDLESVSGKVVVASEPTELEASTVSGDIDLAWAPDGTDVETVSGTVVVNVANGDLDASSVSGSVRVKGGFISNADFETVSGEIRCEAELSGSGVIDFESMSGTVALVVPAGSSGDFNLTTFSGHISNDLGPEPVREKYGPGEEANFSIGGGGPTVNMNSFSGSVKLLTR